MGHVEMNTNPAPAANDNAEGLRAQRTFTAVMRAMSEPGTIHKLDAPSGVPAALPLGQASVVLALADFETPLWLDPRLAADAAVTRYLRFATGAPLVTDPGAAGFALVSDAEQLPPFDKFALGSEAYPDRSVTIVMEVQSFSSKNRYTLTGPGIESSRDVAPGPLPGDFEERMKENRALFPRGVDLILTCAEEVACLPRATRVRRAV